MDVSRYVPAPNPGGPILIGHKKDLRMLDTVGAFGAAASESMEITPPISC